MPQILPHEPCTRDDICSNNIRWHCGPTCPTEGTPLRRMNIIYWPGGATVKSGGAWQVVVPVLVPAFAAVHARTNCRWSMWVEWVTPGIFEMTTLSMVSMPLHWMGKRDPGMISWGAEAITGLGRPDKRYGGVQICTLYSSVASEPVTSTCRQAEKT